MTEAEDLYYYRKTPRTSLEAFPVTAVCPAERESVNLRLGEIEITRLYQV